MLTTGSVNLNLAKVDRMSPKPHCGKVDFFSPSRSGRRESLGSVPEPCAEPQFQIEAAESQIMELKQQVHQIRELLIHNSITDSSGQVVQIGHHIDKLYEFINEQREQTFADCQAIYKHIVNENYERQAVVNHVYEKFEDIEHNVDKMEIDSVRIVESERIQRKQDTMDFERKFKQMDRMMQKIIRDNEELRGEIQILASQDPFERSMHSCCYRTSSMHDSSQYGGNLTKLMTHAGLSLEESMSRTVELIASVPLVGPPIANKVSSILGIVPDHCVSRSMQS